MLQATRGHAAAAARASSSSSSSSISSSSVTPRLHAGPPSQQHQRRRPLSLSRLAPPPPHAPLAHAPPRLRRSVAAGAAGRDAADEAAKQRDRGLALRAEAEAPFRVLRLVFFGFSVVSASIALLVSLPQLAGALGGAKGALPRDDVLVNIAIDSGAALVFGLLFREDWKARDKQLARLAREEALGALPVALANGKNLPLAALRGSARPVLVAGTRAQVEAAVAAAEPYRKELQRRGVVLVAAPVYGDEGGSADEAAAAAAASSSTAAASSAAPSDGADGDEAAAIAQRQKEEAISLLRWRAAVRRPALWRDWLDAQVGSSSASADKGGAGAAKGLFVGLRLDGRVRSSGLGLPPWARYAAELPPLEGEKSWTGFFSSFDGRV